MYLSLETKLFCVTVFSIKFTLKNICWLSIVFDTSTSKPLWHSRLSAHNVALSRTGYVICRAQCQMKRSLSAQNLLGISICNGTTLTPARGLSQHGALCECTGHTARKHSIQPTLSAAGLLKFCWLLFGSLSSYLSFSPLCPFVQEPCPLSFVVPVS